MKKAKVFYNDILCGYLTENDDGYTFYYIVKLFRKIDEYFGEFDHIYRLI